MKASAEAPLHAGTADEAWALLHYLLTGRLGSAPSLCTGKIRVRERRHCALLGLSGLCNATGGLPGLALV